MNILITGGTGLIGANLANYLVRNNCEGNIVIYARRKRIISVLEKVIDAKNMFIETGDILEMNKLAMNMKKYEIDTIIHTASLISDRDSFNEPYAYLNTNIMGLVNIMECSRIFDVKKTVCIGSRAALGSYKPEEGPLAEDNLPRPEAFYGVSKYAGELIVDKYNKIFNTKGVTLRVTGVYGPGQGEQGVGYLGPTAVALVMLSAVLKGEKFVLPQGGEFKMEYTFVNDIIKAILSFIEKDKWEHSVYNVTEGKQYTVFEIADIINSLYPGAAIEVGPGTLPKTPPRAVLDITRFSREFGYKSTPLKAGLIKMVEYTTKGKLSQ